VHHPSGGQTGDRTNWGQTGRSPISIRRKLGTFHLSRGFPPRPDRSHGSYPQVRTRRVTSALAFHSQTSDHRHSPRAWQRSPRPRPKYLFRNILRVSLRCSRFCRGKPGSAPSKFFEIKILRVAVRKNAKPGDCGQESSIKVAPQVTLSLYSAIFCAQMAPAPIKIVSLLRVSNNRSRPDHRKEIRLNSRTVCRRRVGLRR
jgi:hypothetical protein